MAAGLPVIASDWNGYKDTVLHHEVGLRIPSYVPQPGLGLDLANRHAWGQDNYDYYCGHVASFTAIDAAALEDALVNLASHDVTRLEMARRARLRAESLYDWSVVIPQYLELFSELGARRLAAQSAAPCAPHASAPDPYDLFQSYPSEAWGPSTLVQLGPHPAASLAELRSLAMVSFASSVWPTESDANALLAGLSNLPVPISTLLGNFPKESRGHRLRDLLWLAKLGLVSRSRADR
jgi:hypothetical protein